MMTQKQPNSTQGLTEVLPAGEHNMLTLEQAAERLAVHPRTVRRMIAAGELPAYRYGKRLIRIDPADLHNSRRPVTSLGEL